MLKSTPIIAFVATTSPARARKFYGTTLGLRLVSEDPFALVFDAGGTMLRVASVEKVAAAGYTVLGWIVKDISRTARALAKRGVKFRRYVGMEQDEDAIWTSPSGARVAWFVDPDGNTLSLTESARAQSKTRQRKPTRKRPKR